MSVKYISFHKKQERDKMNNCEQINPDEKNEINKTLPNDTNKNSNFVYNSDFIKDLIAFSKIGKKKTNKKDNISQDNKTSKIKKERPNEFSQDNFHNKHIDHKLIYKSNEISPNKNYYEKINTKKRNIFNDNKSNLKSNQITPSNNNYPKHHLSNLNNNINYKLGITERNSPIKSIATQNNLRKNNTLSKFFLSKQKNEKQMPINKSLLNVAVSQVIESPLFGQIKEPKEGHSKGIIQLIKYSKNSPDFKKEKDYFDNENIGNKNNNNKNVQYYQDKKMFDEPNNKIYYHNKIIKPDYEQNIKTNNNSSNNDNKNIMYIHNKTLSYNKFNNIEPSLTLNKNLSYINLNNVQNKAKVETSYDNTKNNNNINNKRLYKKINSEVVFYIKNNNPNIKRQKSNLQKNMALLNRIRKQKNEYDINKTSYNNIINTQTNSPSFNKQMINYRNENLYKDNTYEENVDNLNMYKLNSNSYLSNESINRKYINNITNSHFYNTNRKIKSKERQKKMELLKTETNFAKFNKFKRQRFINSNSNNITINKTNITNRENNSNILYLKPKNNQVNKYPSFIRNKTEKNSVMHSNDLSRSHYRKKIKKNEIFTEGDEILFSNIKNNSPPKSPTQIYRKPIYKNNFLEISKSNNTINNNFIIYKDEINFINRTKEYNIKNENLNIELYNIAKTNSIIKQKVPNKKHNFFTKYYQYNILKSKIDICIYTKECYLYRNDCYQMKMERPNQCKFTKVNIIKFKNIKTKYNNKKIKNDCKNIMYDKNIFKNNNNINNDIIFLLNIITTKNLLNVENQLTKLIIISKNAFNIKNNPNNAILYINDIINNISIFITILINKVINENKYIELYIKLCSDLCNKYLNSINELIIKRYLAKNFDNNKYDIILNFKNNLNQECINKSEIILLSNIDEEKKLQLFNLLDFILLSYENNISNIETFNTIISNIFKGYDKIDNFDFKYYLIYLIIYFLLKLKNNNDKECKNDFNGELYNKIKDIDKANTHKYLIKIIEKFKNEFSINKFNTINNDFDKEQICDKLIKEDFENYINYIKNKNDMKVGNKFDFLIVKNIKLYELENVLKEIINNFVEIITKEEDLIYCKNYIKNIFEPIFGKLSLNKLRTFHNNILPILSNIDQLCIKNIYSFEILGYILYLLIENELCDIQDMNIFINKNHESQINICKIIKYIILSSESNAKMYYENFKNIDLFKNNSLFEDHIKKDIEFN